MQRACTSSRHDSHKIAARKRLVLATFAAAEVFSFLAEYCTTEVPLLPNVRFFRVATSTGVFAAILYVLGHVCSGFHPDITKVGLAGVPTDIPNYKVRSGQQNRP